MAEIWLEIVVKRQFVSVLFFSSPSSYIKAKQYVTVNFICSFDMDHYPFDTQVCKNTIMPVPNSDMFVKLIGKEIIYKGPWNLMKYDVNITLEADEVCNYIFQYLSS